MIRKLAEQDSSILHSYLEQDPLHNIYMIHGQQIYGLVSKAVSFWGAFEGKRLSGVLFAMHRPPSFGCLAGDTVDVLETLGHLALESGIHKLIGKDQYIQPVLNSQRSRCQISVIHLGFFETVPERFVPRRDHPVRVATEDDIPLLIELYRDYELYPSDLTKQEIAQEIHGVFSECGVYLMVEREGKAVSAARIAVESDQAGMIDAATTLPEYRGCGMYSSVRTACCDYLFGKTKITLALIRHDNTTMQSIAVKSGSCLTAEWLIARFRDKPPLRRRLLPYRLRRWGKVIADRVDPRQGRATRHLLFLDAFDLRDRMPSRHMA